MKKDPYLKHLFANYYPPLSDDEEFLNNLTRRLDTIEPARRYYSRERRHLRRSLFVAFLTGIPVGAAMTVFLLFHPLALHSQSYGVGFRCSAGLLGMAPCCSPFSLFWPLLRVWHTSALFSITFSRSVPPPPNRNNYPSLQ